MINAEKDYTRKEQLALDLTHLFDQGIRTKSGQMHPALQGVGSTAAAMQALDQGVPLEYVGLMLTNARENDLDTTQEHPEDLLEEIQDSYPAFARVIQSGIDACETEADYRVFVQWLGLVHGVMIMHQQK
jgi:hypothetical protein